MGMTIGSAAYKMYTYTSTSTAEKKKERFSVGEGKLTQELGQKQGKHYDAVSKYGDTLEISKTARNLMMGIEEPEQKEEDMSSTVQNELQIQRANNGRGERNISTIDYSITDDMIYANL